MVSVANKILHVKEGHTISVGKADIIAHGDIWSSDNEKIKQFKSFMETDIV